MTQVRVLSFPERAAAVREEAEARARLNRLSGPVLVAVDGRLVSEMGWVELELLRVTMREALAKRMLRQQPDQRGAGAGMPPSGTR